MTAFDRLLLALDGHDAYEVLGVDPSSSDEQIRRAFRERARHVHPDVSGDPGIRMTLINNAYSMLRSSRPDYDLHRRQRGERPPSTRTAPDRATADRATAGSLWDDDTADPSSVQDTEEERTPRTDSGIGSLWDVDPTPADVGASRRETPTGGRQQYPRWPAGDPYRTVPAWFGPSPRQGWPPQGRNAGRYAFPAGQYGYRNARSYPPGGYPPRSGRAAVHTHMWLAVICLLVCLPAGVASVHLSSKAGLLARFGDERAARHAARRSLTTSLAGLGVFAALVLVLAWPC